MQCIIMEKTLNYGIFAVYEYFFRLLLSVTPIWIIPVNIYILNVAALDETIISSCLHLSMQNIEQSRGLCRDSRWSNVNVNQ